MNRGKQYGQLSEGSIWGIEDLKLGFDVRWTAQATNTLNFPQIHSHP
jgi:hypothetical protein